MSEAVKKFIPRAPRYVLRTHDRNDMRFSLEHSHGQGGIEKTILLNLSQSGCAFLISPDVEMQLGERIKVEIPIPHGNQIAWWGKVVRMSEYEASKWGFEPDQFENEAKILVGVRFEDLPDTFTRAISKGIKESLLGAMRDQQYRTWIYYKTKYLERAAQVIVYAILTALVVGFIYFFTRPDGNYDAKRGTQWGDRFKF